MKAIHNAVQDEDSLYATVFIPTKIQNESNSQRADSDNDKIFTVFIPTKIQNESNSQPKGSLADYLGYCIYPYKDTK